MTQAALAKVTLGTSIVIAAIRAIQRIEWLAGPQQRMACRDDAIIRVIVGTLGRRRRNASALEAFIPFRADGAVIARSSVRLSLRETRTENRMTACFHTIGGIVETDDFGCKVLGTFLIVACPYAVAGVAIIEHFALRIHNACTDEDTTVTQTVFTLLIGGAWIAVVASLALLQLVDADTRGALIHRAGIPIIALVHLSRAGSIVTIIVERTEIAIGAGRVARSINRRTFARIGLAHIETTWVGVHVAHNVVTLHAAPAQTDVTALAEIIDLRTIRIHDTGALGIQCLAFASVAGFILRALVAVVAR